MKRITAAAASFVIALMAAFAAAAPGRADDYPTRPIRLILPQPAGGAVDLIARTVGDLLSQSMKQPVIIENMPGANGSLAAGQVARADADGYTLLMAVDSNLVINPSLYRNLSYDPFNDFVPISIMAKLHMVLVANPKVEANTLGELIAYAKAHPNKLNYASIGIGSAPHLGMELFKYMTKTEINNVSYRGTAPAMTDVVGGIVDVMLTGPPSAKSMSEGGKLKLLAVAGPERSPLMPNVPTATEAGVAGYEMASWFALLAPAKTPKAIVDKLSGEVKKAVTDARFLSRMSTQGLEPVGSTSEQMRDIMRADTKRWADLIKVTGTHIPQ